MPQERCSTAYARFGVVLRDTPAGVVPDPEVVLRVGITAFRQSLQLLKHFLRTVRLWFSHDAVAVDPGPTAGWRAVQCEELRLTRVGGVFDHGLGQTHYVSSCTTSWISAASGSRGFVKLRLRV